MALQPAPLIGIMEPLSSIPGISDRHSQLLTVVNFEIIWNSSKVLVHVMLIVSVIAHKYNITETDDYQSACELFQSCFYDQNQNRSTTGF